MPVIKMNMNETPDEIPLIPVGEVAMEINIAPEVQTSQAGNEMLQVVFEAKDCGKATGSKIYHYFTKLGSNDRTDVQFKRLWKSCGLPIPEGKSFDTEDLIGKTCRAIVRKKEYQGDEGREIKDFVVSQS